MMTPPNWFTIAAACMGCAIAVGFHTASRPETESSGKQYFTWAKSKIRENPREVSEASPLGSQQTHTVPSKSEAGSEAKKPEVTRRPRSEPAPRESAPLLTEAQWRERAIKVELEAIRELDRLSALLDLDPIQQEMAFAALARQSDYWLPGMKTTADRLPTRQQPPAGPATPADRMVPIDGSTTIPTPVAGTTPEPDDLTAVLTPEQQQALLEADMDRKEWWAEVLPKLAPPGFPDVGMPVETGLPPGSKPYEGEDVLPED